MVIIFVLLMAATISAQTVISVDEDLSKNRDKNLVLAVAASAVLPGTGHYYLGHKRAASFFWIDAALWVSVASTWIYSDNQIENAMGYAARHAGANPVKKDLAYLTVIGDYRSRGGHDYQNSSPDNNEDYNMAMIRAGQEIDAVYPKEYTWDWGTSDSSENTARIKEYKEILKRHRISKIAFQISLGAMALNRVLAILDVMRIYRQTTANFSFIPLATPQYSGVFVNYEF